MNDLKDIFKVLYQFKTDYLKVTLLLTILQAFVMGPFIYYFFFFILRVIGVPGITDANLGEVFFESCCRYYAADFSFTHFTVYIL